MKKMQTPEFLKKLNTSALTKKLKAPASLKKARTPSSLKLKAPASLKKLKAPSMRNVRPPASLKSVKAPTFASNLYRDLRDRRLLVPALALAIALLAVPLILSSSSTTTAPATSPVPGSASSGPEDPTSPAVLAEQLGVTDYRQRLEQGTRKDPFRRHFTSLPKGAKLDTSSSLSTDTTATDATVSSSVEPATSSGSSTVSSSTSGSPGSGSSPGAANDHERPVLFFVRRRIDVKVGPLGSVTEKERVKQLSFLPSGGTPLVAYLGTNESGTRALFDVSSDVTSASGDGECRPSPSTCRFVSLKEGEVEKFDYAPDAGTPYKLQLLAIRDVVTKSPSSR
jgi:hypothetical protein